MTLSLLVRRLAVTTLLALGLIADTAHAAPADLPSTPLDLELRDADVTNVLRMLAEVGKRELVLDPCVRGKVDLKLSNTPLPLVLDALAAKLRLTYEDDRTSLRVGCVTNAATKASLDARVAVDVNEAAIDDVARYLADAGKLAGVDYRAKSHPKVSMKLSGVRLATAVAALAESTGLKITMTSSRMVITE